MEGDTASALALRCGSPWVPLRSRVATVAGARWARCGLLPLLMTPAVPVSVRGMETSIDWEKLRQTLCALQDVILATLGEARGGMSGEAMSGIAEITPADTIYTIDKLIEETILTWLARHWPEVYPVELVMEGLELRGPVTFPEGTPVGATLLRLIVDPIDGTRELMWDRRSAWALSGLAPQRGSRTRLAEVQVAAMTELPTTRAWRADQFSVVRGEALKGATIDILNGTRRPFVPQPYDGIDLRHGFGSLGMPFPAAKQVVAAITERLLAEVTGEDLASLPVFEDQYLSTGGQMHDLMTGRLRFFGDLRPSIFQRCGMPEALCAHPYDVCATLVAEATGVVILGLDGKPLDAPLDTLTPVSWVGYANRALAEKMHPALIKAIDTVLG